MNDFRFVQYHEIDASEAPGHHFCRSNQRLGLLAFHSKRHLIPSMDKFALSRWSPFSSPVVTTKRSESPCAACGSVIVVGPPILYQNLSCHVRQDLSPQLRRTWPQAASSSTPGPASRGSSSHFQRPPRPSSAYVPAAPTPISHIPRWAGGPSSRSTRIIGSDSDVHWA